MNTENEPPLCSALGHDPSKPCWNAEVANDPNEAGDLADLLIESTRFRMQCRVDSCLDKCGGNVGDAIVGRGVGISYLFAKDVVSALERAASEIARLREMLNHLGKLAEADHDHLTAEINKLGTKSP